MLLGQVEMEKRFMDLDGQEQRDRLDEDMELEYAFDMEEDTLETLTAGNGGTTGVPSAEDMGVPESFVIGDTGEVKAGNFGSKDEGDTPEV